MLRYYHTKDPQAPPSAIDAPQEGSWIIAEKPTADELKQLSQMASLHPAELESCVEKYAFPHIEKIEGAVLVQIRIPDVESRPLHTSLLSLIVAPHYFFCIAPEQSALTELVIKAPMRCSTEERGRLLSTLLHRAAKQFLDALKKSYASSLEQSEAFLQIKKEDISTLKEHEEILTQYQSTIGPMIRVYEMLLSKKYLILDEEEESQLHDGLNALKQAESMCTVSLRTLLNLKDNYQTLFANNLQKTIKLLTGLTIILNIPSTIESFFGMNVHLPFQTSPYAFFLIIILMVLLSIGGIYYFRKKQWL